jgi:HAMP domain-containing protein
MGPDLASGKASARKRASNGAEFLESASGGLKMKLLMKFNLVLFLVFAIGLVSAGYVCNRLLQQNAKAEIMENARIMIEAASAVRTYTTTQIKPLLETQIKYTFLPQIVPAYSANAYFSQLQKKFPDYSYKEATLNPTNPINRATDWEADIVEEFRRSHDKTEIVGERDTPNGRTLYMARPMKVSSPACLSCHDTAEGAPRTVVERYGSANGFGWQLNDIVTAQIVSVPTQLALKRAKGVFTTFMISLATVFGVLAIAINALLVLLVIRPVNRLSTAASNMSLGTVDIGEFPVSGKDEIAELSQSFNRMGRSLVEAMKMLRA